ncbi:MAG: hypothetical protein Q8S71_08970, partial [Hydrogenophaga sp.]|nr:hypothetical protein [Hydrogenophaga sp.]
EHRLNLHWPVAAFEVTDSGNTFFLCRFSLANQSPGGPPAAWQEPDFKISKTEFRNTFHGATVSGARKITERMLHYHGRNRVETS